MLFFLKNVVRAKFGRYYKIRTIEKKHVIYGVFSILVLLDHRNREQYFPSRKKTEPRFVPSFQKKISVLKNEV